VFDRIAKAKIIIARGFNGWNSKSEYTQILRTGCKDSNLVSQKTNIKNIPKKPHPTTAPNFYADGQKPSVEP
jgi:hypothetical protein